MSQTQFALQRIYLKDASVEVPAGAGVFLQQWNPEVSIDLNTEHHTLEDGKHVEVSVSVTVTARNNSDVAFLVEVKQAGIFLVEGISDAERAPLLSVYCPNLLFPYAREAISDLVGKASFPQLLLQPVNFEALYHEKLRAMAAASETAQ